LSRLRVPGYRPAIIDPDVAAFGPAEFLEFVPECTNKGLPFAIALGISHQHTDPARAARLLRTHDGWCCQRRAADQRDEIAPSHAEAAPRYPRTIAKAGAA